MSRTMELWYSKLGLGARDDELPRRFPSTSCESWLSHAVDEIKRDTRNVIRSRYPVAAIAASSARSFPGRSLTFASYRDTQVSRTMPHVTRSLPPRSPFDGGLAEKLRELSLSLSQSPPHLPPPPIRVVSGNNFAHRQNGMLIRFTSHWPCSTYSWPQLRATLRARYSCTSRARFPHKFPSVDRVCRYPPPSIPYRSPPLSCVTYALKWRFAKSGEKWARNKKTGDPWRFRENNCPSLSF